jgi:hypothetical protein
MIRDRYGTRWLVCVSLIICGLCRHFRTERIIVVMISKMVEVVHGRQEVSFLRCN